MPTLRDVRIRSATGRDVQTLGRTITQFKLGVTTCTAEFHNMQKFKETSHIRNRFFLGKIGWEQLGQKKEKFALQKGDDILVEKY